MFPHGSMSLVEKVYKENPHTDRLNTHVADAVEAFLKERLRVDSGAKLRILEVGAGTGGTSAAVISRLSAYTGHVAEYAYTDLSQAFLFHAQDRFGADAPYLRTLILDLETPFEPQGLERGNYDLVIATNVLHATRNIRRTLRHVKTALGRNGVLVLNELMHNSLSVHVTFGLLEGWWRFDDGALREPGSPLLSLATWKSVLEQEGFIAPFAMGTEQQVIVAGSNGIVLRASVPPFVQAPSETVIEKAVARVHETAPELNGGTAREEDDRLLRVAETHVAGVFARVIRLSVEQIDPDRVFPRLRARFDYGSRSG